MMIRLILILSMMFAVLATAWGRQGEGELAVLQLNFELRDQPGAGEPWYEASVVFSVEQGSRLPTANPRFVDDTEVRLRLAFEREGRGQEGYRFYAADAVIETMEVGRKVIRFYIPKERVKRDRIRGEPFLYEVEFYLGDEMAARLASPNLRSREARAAFHARMESAPQESRGTLLLQSETPFRDFDARDTPRSVRSPEKPVEEK